MAKKVVRVVGQRVAQRFKWPLNSIQEIEEGLARTLIKQGEVRAEFAYMPPSEPNPVSEIPPADKAVGGPSPHRQNQGVKPVTKAPPFFGKARSVKRAGLKVAWIQDAEKIGGAELSNFTVVRMGRRLGHEIFVVTPQDFKPEALLAADVIILNGFYAFSETQLRHLYYVLYEEQVPYVRYEHDHREVSGGTIRLLNRRPFLGFARRLFHRSILNIFISPLHHAEFIKALGEDIREHPNYLLPPAVDPGHFRTVGDVERVETRMVSTTGQLLQRKGLLEVMNLAASRPNMEIWVYTKPWDSVISLLKNRANIKVFDPVDYEKLPAVYSGAGIVVHLPEFYEDCGRTPVEGALCGCQVFSNAATGAMTFDFWERFGTIQWNEDRRCIASITDRGGFADYLLQGQAGFWKAVEESL